MTILNMRDQRFDKAPFKAYHHSTEAKAPKKPRRALTAYNIFTGWIRERILDGSDGHSVAPTMEDIKRITLQQKTKKRRKHRKTHGRIGFQELSKIIAIRWRELPEEHRELFETQARIEKDERDAKLRSMADGDDSHSDTSRGSSPSLSDRQGTSPHPHEYRSMMKRRVSESSEEKSPMTGKTMFQTDRFHKAGQQREGIFQSFREAAKSDQGFSPPVYSGSLQIQSNDSVRPRVPPPQQPLSIRDDSLFLTQSGPVAAEVLPNPAVSADTTKSQEVLLDTMGIGETTPPCMAGTDLAGMFTNEQEKELISEMEEV